MTTPTVGLVGGGRIARIFCAGWTRAKELPGCVVVADPNREALTNLQAQFPKR